MSGGSWDYLYSKDYGSCPMWDYAGRVRDMADRLVEMGYEPEAREMHALALRLDHMRIESESRWESLRPVMKAVEWRDSGDYGDDNLREVIELRRNGVKVPA